LQGG